jgi:hypothetical protein
MKSAATKTRPVLRFVLSICFVSTDLKEDRLWCESKPDRGSVRLPSIMMFRGRIETFFASDNEKFQQLAVFRDAERPANLS